MDGTEMTIDELIREYNLEPKTISEIIKEFHKIARKHTNLQVAVAFEILLRLVIKDDSQRQLIDTIVDSYDINVDDE